MKRHLLAALLTLAVLATTSHAQIGGGRGTLLTHDGINILPTGALDASDFGWDGTTITVTGGGGGADNMGDANARGSNLTTVASGSGLTGCLWLTNNVLISKGVFYIVPDGQCMTDISTPPCGTIRHLMVQGFSDSYVEAASVTQFVEKVQFYDCTQSPTSWVDAATYMGELWLAGDLNMRSNDVVEIDELRFVRRDPGGYSAPKAVIRSQAGSESDDVIVTNVLDYYLSSINTNVTGIAGEFGAAAFHAPSVFAGRIYVEGTVAANVNFGGNTASNGTFTGYHAGDGGGMTNIFTLAASTYAALSNAVQAIINAQ